MFKNNRLIKTVEGNKETINWYDNAGNRFIKQTKDVSTNKKNTSLYLRHGQIAVAMDIEITGDSTTDKGKINRYILSGDLLAGRVTTTVKLDNSKETAKYYYHLDHLNSTKCVTKGDGTLVVMYEYRAFGEQLKKLGGSAGSPTGEAKYTYGGKELDDETNLYYFNARYYDATIGRFINVDPVQDGTNWYVYCNNNPLSFVDPTGLADILARRAGIDGAVGFFANDIPLISPGHSLVVYKENGNNKSVQYGEYGVKMNKEGNNGPYTIKYSGLDDKLTAQAIKNTIDSEKYGGGNQDKAKEKYSGLRNNCNSFTDSVFKEYQSLYKNQLKDELTKKYTNEDGVLTKTEKEINEEVNTGWKEHYKDITSDKGKEIKTKNENMGANVKK